MPAALAKMYNSLSSQQKEQVYNFVASFYNQNVQSVSKAEEVIDAFGMWKDRADFSDVDSFSRELRKGRNFDN